MNLQHLIKELKNTKPSKTQNKKPETQDEVKKLYALIDYYDTIPAPTLSELASFTPPNKELTTAEQESLDSFWAIIDSINQRISINEINYKLKWLKILESELNLMGEETLRQFENNLNFLAGDDLTEKSLNQTKYSGYYSDDGLYYLGLYIVSRGEEFYKKVITNSTFLEDQLNIISNNQQDMDATEFEEFAGLVDEQLEKLTH